MPKAASARRKAVSGQQRRGWSGNKAFPAAGRVFIPQFRGVSAMPYSWLLPALCAAFLLVMSPASDATKVSVPIDKAIEVCGISGGQGWVDVRMRWSVRGPGGSRFLRKASIRADGRKVMTYLTFFNEPGAMTQDSSLVGKTAPCPVLTAAQGGQGCGFKPDRMPLRPRSAFRAPGCGGNGTRAEAASRL
ncbi:hypothetical protein [Salipiger sp.]|uniref:hypothetical protein n=1 Tax=Salipiger sp. TaxID=2078585 RepID=UPI003A986F07